jgi:gamma-glutamyltranspeptidase
VRKIYDFRDLFIGDPYKMNIDLMNYLRHKDIKKIDYNNIISRETQRNDTTFLVVADDHDNMIGFIQVYSTHLAQELLLKE